MVYFWKDTTDLPLATGKSDVNKAAGVRYSLLRATLGGLLLLLWLNLCHESGQQPLNQFIIISASPCSVPHDQEIYT